MTAERRLISIGFPPDEAATLCSALRRENALDRFIQEQEEIYRAKCAAYVKEMMD